MTQRQPLLEETCYQQQTCSQVYLGSPVWSRMGLVTRLGWRLVTVGANVLHVDDAAWFCCCSHALACMLISRHDALDTFLNNYSKLKAQDEIQKLLLYCSDSTHAFTKTRWIKWSALSISFTLRNFILLLKHHVLISHHNTLFRI